MSSNFVKPGLGVRGLGQIFFLFIQQMLHVIEFCEAGARVARQRRRYRQNVRRSTRSVCTPVCPGTLFFFG